MHSDFLKNSNTPPPITEKYEMRLFPAFISNGADALDLFT
jgi:hypothetical protein